MAVNNKIPAEDVVRKHKSTKIRRTREPDSNVTVYVRLPCATLLIVYEDIGFLYVCSVFTRYRVRKMRCALVGFALKSRSDRATLSLRIACFLLPVFCKERRPFWLAGFSGWLSGISALSVPTNSPKTERSSKPSAHLINISPRSVRDK